MDTKIPHFKPVTDPDSILDIDGDKITANKDCHISGGSLTEMIKEDAAKDRINRITGSESYQNFVSKWQGIQRAVMEKYVENKHKPIRLTDKEEVLAICISEGHCEFTSDEANLIIRTKYPVDIDWDGSKFLLILHNSNNEARRKHEN